MSTVLTDEDKILLYEIYGLTELPTTTIVLGINVVYPDSLSPYLLASGGSNLRFNNIDATALNSLANAIAVIDTRPAYVTRVQEILAEYKKMSLDPQTKGERDGYNQKTFVKNIRVRLYPYTSLMVRDVDSGLGGGNKLNIG